MVKRYLEQFGALIPTVQKRLDSCERSLINLVLWIRKGNLLTVYPSPYKYCNSAAKAD